MSNVFFFKESTSLKCNAQHNLLRFFIVKRASSKDERSVNYRSCFLNESVDFFNS